MRTEEIENELNGVSLGELSDMTVGQFAKMLSNEDPDQKLVIRHYNSNSVPAYFKFSRINQLKSAELGALVIDVRRALKAQVNERAKETEEEKLERLKKQIELKLQQTSAKKKRQLYKKAVKKGIKKLPPLERFVAETCKMDPAIFKKRGPKPKKKEPTL